MSEQTKSRVSVPVGRFPVPAGARDVLFFGGTFDPPHRAHIELPILARRALGADLVLFVPAGQSPHKKTVAEASDAQRVEMLRAALEEAGEPRVSISTFELEEAPAERRSSFTLETLRALRRELGADVRVRLLIGADQAVKFHSWREPRELVRMAAPMVMLRTPLETADRLLAEMAPHWSAEELASWRERVIELPMVDAEATRIRAALRERGGEAPELEAMLPPAVLRYVRERGLYKAAQ